MRLYIYSLCFLSSFSLFVPLSAHADANNTPGVKSEKLLESEQSWDGTAYKSYPEGTPQLSVLKLPFHLSDVWRGMNIRPRMLATSWRGF